MKIKHRYTGKVLLIIQGANLQGANLQEADLQGANLQWADLQGANLQWADLQGANLQGANLQGANLQGTNLQVANLQVANLQGANLQGANLQGADLDYSSGFTLSCTSFDVTCDIRLAAQLAYHFCRLNFPNSIEAQAAQQALAPLANKFHRIEETNINPV